MKTKLTIILTSLLLFVGTIYVLANYPYQTNTPVQKEEKKPIRVVLSLPDADTAMVQLANVYEAVERIECLTQGEGRKIKNQLVAVINKIQARVDTTGKK